MALSQAEEEEADDGRTRPKVRRTQVVVSAEVKAKHAGAQAQIDQGAGLSDAEIASARRVLVEHMQPRETVMQALTRLSAKPRDSQVPPQLLALLCLCSRLSKTHTSCAGFTNCPLHLAHLWRRWAVDLGITQFSCRWLQQSARARVGKRELTAEESQRQGLIDRITDAASSIMSQEADIFDQRKEEIEHALKLSDLSLQAPAGACTPCPTAHWYHEYCVRQDDGPGTSLWHTSFPGRKQVAVLCRERSRWR